MEQRRLATGAAPLPDQCWLHLSRTAEKDMTTQMAGGARNVPWPVTGNHRGQTFLVVGHQVCTHLRRVFGPLLFADPLQVIKVLRLMFVNSNIQLPSQILYGIKVWILARPLQHLNVLLLEPLLCCLGRVFWVIIMLEYPSTTHF